MFYCADLVIDLLKLIQDKFDCTLPIEYLYGSPPVKWNGGRLLVNADFPTLSGIEQEVKKITHNGIVPLFTFSNPLILERDLDDPLCNNVLNIIAEYNCQIIVTNECLEEYIRQKFPSLKIHKSVISVALCKRRSLELYSSLEKYCIYCIHPDDNFDHQLLHQLKKENAEIILNERCTYGCKLRKEHYFSISREQSSLLSHSNDFKYENFLKLCSSIPEIKQFSLRNRNISLTIREMQELVNMGFNIFKIQGRTDSLYTFFFDVLRYTLDNDLVFPLVYPIYVQYIDKYIRQGRVNG